MLLGVSLLRKIAQLRDLKTFSKIPSSWFLSAEEKDLYLRVLEYVKDYGMLPPHDSIGDEDDDTDHALEFLINRMSERYDRSRLGVIATMIQASLPVEDINAAISRYLFSNDTSGDVISGRAITEIIRENIDKARQRYVSQDLSGYHTGWPTLDKATGGYQDGDVIVFSGRAKTGKTMLMLFSLNRLLSKHTDAKALFVSMEMTTNQVLNRLGCLRAGINPETLRIGDVTTPVEETILNSLDELSDRLYITEGNVNKRLDSIISTIGTIKPNIVFIDGAYLIRSANEKWEKDWERVKFVIESLKSIALTFKIPIVCSYQLNRSARKSGDLGLEHLAMSDAVGQIASIVLGIVNVEGENRKRIEIVGIRDGLDEDFNVNWDWNRLDFSEEGYEAIGQTDRGLSEEDFIAPGLRQEARLPWNGSSGSCGTDQHVDEDEE